MADTIVSSAAVAAGGGGGGGGGRGLAVCLLCFDGLADDADVADPVADGDDKDGNCRDCSMSLLRNVH